MKNLLSFLFAIMLFPNTAFAAENDRFPANVESMTDTTVTLSTTRAAQFGEYYSASCSPYTGQEDYNGFTVQTSITVPNLTKNVQYTCRIYIYPSSNGGVVQGMSQDVVFIAGDINSVQVQNPVVTLENQKPMITDVKYNIAVGAIEEGNKISFTASVFEPENEAYQLRFWVCKYDGSVCYNAMNGANEEWTSNNDFAWIAPSGGNYQLKVIVIDSNHNDESNPFGDHEYNLNFIVYSPSTSVNNSNFTVAQSEPPAGYEDVVLTAAPNLNPFPDTDINTLIGKAAAELYRRAIIGGYPDGQFKGSKPVNRAEAAKFLLLTKFGSVNETVNNGQFPDVLDGQWYTKFVITAAQKGIINGYPDGFFKPADTVNTAEFLKMLTLTFGLNEYEPYSFTDVSDNIWYAKYAGIAQKYNLFPNRSTRLAGSSNLTREEVATAIYQYLSNR